jgi:hypothetical protein
VAIKLPPLKAPPALVCDWLEITVLGSERNSYRLNRLKRIWDVNRETENSDPEGLNAREENTDETGFSGEDADAFLDSISDEIVERDNALGGTYPFELEKNGTAFKLKDQINEGGHIYIFCLLLSNSKAGDILDGKWIPNINHITRDLFQACSTLAAAGNVDGCAISFGWPRPNKNPPFLKRLRSVYKEFGEGVVRKKPIPGTSPNPKDEEIDVIAWKPTRDNAPGTAYMLGQVASGDNWEAKSVKGPPIESFHRNWFMPPPASEVTAAIFIPHLVTPNQTGTRRDVMQQHTTTYGRVIDRLRLPHFAHLGIGLADTPGQTMLIERRNDVAQIISWVQIQLQALKASIK